MSFVSTDPPSHSGNNVWLTPLHIVKALGEFDLDPCGELHWPTAKTIFTKKIDGLSKNWFGRVWLNPPYGKEINPFLDRMKAHNNGVVLVFARPDTEWWQNLYIAASAVFAIRGRLKFHRFDGSTESNAGVGSSIFFFGDYERPSINGIFLKESKN
jgi:hypothetical protein